MELCPDVGFGHSWVGMCGQDVVVIFGIELVNFLLVPAPSDPG